MTNESPLSFQLLGTTTRDVAGAYEITLFGATPEGRSVSLAVTGFQPFFYLSDSSNRLQRHLLAQLNDQEKASVVFTTEKHRTFWDFTNNKTITVLKIQTRTKRLWSKLRDLCQDAETAIPKNIKLSTGEIVTPVVYEANIDPMLRFFHLRELKPAGWASVPPGQWEDHEDTSTTTALQLTAPWDQVGPADDATQLTSAPLKIMSWDIECTSSHGDFPLAIKTWRKPARELVAAGITDWTRAFAAIKQAVASKGPLSTIYLPANGLQEMELAAPHVAASWMAAHDDAIDHIDALLTRHFPAPDGDPIIQIGSVVYVSGKPVRKDIFVLGSCNKVPGPDTFTHSFATEAGIIKGWCKLIAEIDPDIMVGYNIFGFDDKYLWDRATVCNCAGALRVFGRTDKPVRLQEKFLSSSAMGDNTFHVISGEGRMHIDLLAYVRRNAVLDSYSLDNVTATFMSGSVSGVSSSVPNEIRIATKSTKGTIPGRYIVLMDEENDVIGEKLEVLAVEPKALILRLDPQTADDLKDGMPPVRWSQSKDNVSPKDIFALHAKGPADRSKVAKYCIQDCDLVMELLQKLEVINNSVAMANVCWVPLDFIFTRGQGIKSESLVFYECRKEDQLIPVLPSPPQRQEPDTELHETPEIVITKDDHEGYEGAIVLEPKTGIYLDDEPVAALDFSSLYPSSIISENLSHDSVVWVKDYDLKGNFVTLKEGGDTYDNLPGIEYLEVDYDILKPDPADTRKHPELKPSGRRVCRYATSQMGTLPKILQKLLSARKSTRKQAEKETDDFRKSLLDAQQLAYKLTANSLYGQLGSNTSKIRRKCLAASTTAHGRQQLLFSKACIERAYGSPDGVQVDKRCDAVVVYGDTDSVFISFRPMNPETGVRLVGREAQAAAKELAEEAGALISGALKPPHDFEFDKMFRCFCLLSKKRYVGDMTEGGLADSDYHRKSMGIVMKRRDNAPIVKTIYGGAIERILAQRDIAAAFAFVRSAAADLLAGKFPMKRLTITKSLRAEYKAVPAHKVLADRMGRRDPGNKPSSNDRIPFVYIQNPTGRKYAKDVCQGDRMETPPYIQEHGLKPDYPFYITNQIAKPVAQVFGLVVEQLPGVKKNRVAAAASAKDPVAAREALAEEMLFGDLLVRASGQSNLMSFFKPV